ncbi:Monooxygenase [Streptomyces hygroscopicus subsp. limoneus]|nr:Monooxygenase [Streptomyces hygroscopicus subsp. limoneus]
MGAGFLVAPHLALTCAHVVTAALGRHDGDSAPSADTAIEVDLPLVRDSERTRAMLTNPEARVHMDKAATIASDVQPRLFRVASSHRG